MRTRLVFGALGFAALAWGAWSLLDDGLEALVSLATYLVAVVAVHDFVLAPLTVLALYVGGRVLPTAARGPAAVGLLVWATCTAAFFVVLSGQGGKPGNPTILGRPYLLSWAVFTLVVLIGVALATGRRAAGRDRPS